jgi:hypothetical protein
MLAEVAEPLVAAVVAGALASVHLRTLEDPNSNAVTRTLWRYYSAKWISPFAPKTRLRSAIAGFVAIGLLAVGFAVSAALGR